MAIYFKCVQQGIEMKRKLQTTLKLLLVFLIFLGLQGRVIARYAESLNKKLKSEINSSKGICVRVAIIHCKLQCYTKKFQQLTIPSAIDHFSFILVFFTISWLYIPFSEHLIIVNPVPLLRLRAPPMSPFHFCRCLPY